LRKVRPTTSRPNIQHLFLTPFQLQLNFLDLYLIHSPTSIKNGDVEGCWNDMIKVKEAGLAKYLRLTLVLFPGRGLIFCLHRSIGVSNFTLGVFQRVIKTGKIVPAVNQVRKLEQRRKVRGSLTNTFLDTPPPVQLRIMERRTDVFPTTWHCD
jgi:hypothetical protein